MKGRIIIFTFYSKTLGTTIKPWEQHLHTPDLPESAIKRVLVFNSRSIYFTDLFILYIFIQNAYVNKKVFKKKILTNDV